MMNKGKTSFRQNSFIVNLTCIKNKKHVSKNSTYGIIAYSRLLKILRYEKEESRY